MVLFFTTTLSVSIIGLVGLIVLKRFELETGHVVFLDFRPRFGSFFEQVLLWAEHILPTLARVWSRRALRAASARVHRGVARLVLFLEHGLERSLHFIRHSTDVRRSAGEASAFLREVAEHKKKLLRTQTAYVRMVED